MTVGPSGESASSVSNIGVAAHITAAAPGGPRYDSTLSPTERSSITNGIWLCQNHAKLIDSDVASWPVARLYALKRGHEQYVSGIIGMPQQPVPHSSACNYSQPEAIRIREYAFLPTAGISRAYKEFIGPILRDRGLADGAELGVLMCGSPPEQQAGPDRETPWTVFVSPAWLRWFLEGQSFGAKGFQVVPPEQVYGQIPAWPDSFFDFLAALVQTGSTFVWQRHAKGYLVLSQPASVS